MKWAAAKFFCDLFERQGLLEMLFDEATHRPHHYSLGIAAGGFRFAAEASAVSGTLCMFRNVEELDVLPQRPASRAGWPAINACGRDCEDKLAITAGIASHNRLPTLFVRQSHGI